ncbi:MAG: trigger factor family protein [bacterium]|nr:trigger factor family protein [bacterium]
MEILEYTEINPITYRMKLRIGMDEMKTEFENVLEAMTKDSEIPGFRTGNAPSSIVKRYIGAEGIWRQARDRATFKAFEEALKEKGSSCILKPEIDHTEYDGQGDYEVKVIYHPEPPSPQELMKKFQNESMFDNKGPDEHIPEHLKRDPDEDHRRLLKGGPTFDLNKGKKA